MRCAECGAADTRVVDSRDTGDTVRRRRECQECSARFTTHERVERRALVVAKRDGRREPFQREKVLEGIRLACRKRPLSEEELDAMADRVLRRLEDCRDATIPTTLVGETVMQVLREVDEVAYVRFASVYGAFESVGQFVDVLAPFRARDEAAS